ncbi:unnamed protein product [Blepharisma stoltei]|uniref:Cyclic nucleotide-binding domain-containing protein n=1 Tax=Blepharisma stoltei TaxID=1481888 RepID=A0AAU9J953_9CILI|nr:unnamed protein product [Blepharisma stoltei]
MNAWISNSRRSKRRYSDISFISNYEDESFSDESPMIEPLTDAWFPSRQITRSNLISISFLESEAFSQKTFIIQPESKFKLFWDIFISILIAIQLVYTPIVLFLADTESKTLKFTDLVLNELFILDIIVKFNTASYSKGHIIKTRLEIAKKYLKSWFLYDIITSIPIEELYELCNPVGSENPNHMYFSLHRIFEYTKIIRTVRVIKLANTMTLLEDFIPNQKFAIIFRFFKLILIAFYVNHYVACLWYYINFLDSFIYPVTWYDKLRNYGDFNMEDLYIRAFYFAVATTSTLGYGDYAAYSRDAMIFDILNMGIAVIIVSYIIGNISDWVVAQTVLRIDFSRKMANLNNYMNKKRLPKELKFKLRTYFDYLQHNPQITHIDELKVFDLLSTPLREEIAGITRGKVFKHCSIFQQLYGTKLINEISKKIRIERYAPDDVIFEEGEKSHTLYFISVGIVEIYHKRTLTIFKELNEDSYFGEIGFFAMHPRTASIRCIAFCEFIVCDRNDLNEILKTKPEAQQRTAMLYNYCQRDTPNRYSILGIKCYLCGVTGHAAAHCYKVLIKKGDEQSKEKWLKEREYGKKIQSEIITRLKRRKSHKRPEKYFAKSPIGSVKHLEDSFKENSALVQKMRNFLDAVREEQIKSIKVDNSSNFARKTYLNVIGNSSSESSDEEFSPRKFSDLSGRSRLSYVNTDNLFRFRSDKTSARGSSNREEISFFDIDEKVG